MRFIVRSRITLRYKFSRREIICDCRFSQWDIGGWQITRKILTVRKIWLAIGILKFSRWENVCSAIGTRSSFSQWEKITPILLFKKPAAWTPAKSFRVGNIETRKTNWSKNSHSEKNSRVPLIRQSVSRKWYWRICLIIWHSIARWVCPLIHSRVTGTMCGFTKFSRWENTRCLLRTRHWSRAWILTVRKRGRPCAYASASAGFIWIYRHRRGRRPCVECMLSK